MTRFFAGQTGVGLPCKRLGEGRRHGVADLSGNLLLCADEHERVGERLEPGAFAQSDVPVLRRMRELTAGETVEACGDRGGGLAGSEPAVDVPVPDARGAALVTVDAKPNRKVLESTSRRDVPQPLLIQLGKTRATMERILRRRRQVRGR
jgi:hypothetical protein